ncbi:TSUP family transporter [Isorropodon fossajaponicum symbiont]|uniref:TSUP family transporter n=1 Tax=Isorropodon fossajaponicum symbiont TaxID=883811 RepID=UPI001CECFB02|nr:TSUP family transporter [Isorropodon fossajaponicum symbiont]
MGFFLGVTGYIIGLVSAIVGIGGGTMTTPFLVYNNINIKNAIATSVSVGMPIAIAGSLGFIITGIGAEGVTSGLGFIHTKALLSIVITPVSCLHHLWCQGCTSC